MDSSIILPSVRKFLKNKQYFNALSLYNNFCLANGDISHIVKYNIEKLTNLITNGESGKIRKSIFVGIAAIPERRESLDKTIKSLLPQVDKIGVYLNNWREVPEFLRNDKITIEGFGGDDLGDVGKFYWVDDHEGVYLTCDDDLIYPQDYVFRMLCKLELYNYKAAVAWHGSLILDGFKEYYDRESRRVFSFGSHRPFDTPVHILGTGCLAFHTNYIKIKKSFFAEKNMADVFFALYGKNNKIPFFVVEHKKNEILEHEGTKESSIYNDSKENKLTQKNTHIIQNSLIKKSMPWILNSHDCISVLLIGRTETYTKGGIYKSCHLIKKHLENCGHKVILHDINNSLDVMLPKYDICWIYVGDPLRPDFDTVDKKISILKNNNIPVIINLSYINIEDRSIWIKEKLKEYNKDKKTPVLAVFFTETAANDVNLASVYKYTCIMPKTLSYDKEVKKYSYEEREGICFGDATKLGNHSIIGGDPGPWIEAVAKRLPNVNLYAYKQYQGAAPHPNIKLLPYFKTGLGDWMAQRRLFVCLNTHLTFEMVPCESQFCGTPVIYRYMPQSLSEYISSTGFSVRNPEELAEVVDFIYNNKKAWNDMSSASILNANSNKIEIAESSIDGYLRLALVRIRHLIEEQC